MLTRSPVPASPSTVSTRSGFPAFHYAPAPSPRHSPSRVPPALSSRQSTSSPSGSGSISSPSFSRPKRYVAVDAATQYSPMEQVDYRTGAIMTPAPPLASTDAVHEPPPPPQPQPMVLADEPCSSSLQQDSSYRPATSLMPRKINPESSTQAGRMETGSSAQSTSPTKRRNFQDPGSLNAGVAPAVQEQVTVPKRPRPAEAAPKILPIRYELCAVEDVVVLIAHMLGELIQTNDGLALRTGHLTRFHSRTAPGISVLDYLHRLAKHATLIPPLLLSMVYYIDRLCAMYPEFTINTLTVHRFLITAATVAAKGLSDAFWNNSTYARVGGVRVAELKLLELEFLYRVDWKIVPNHEVLVAYYKGLIERCPGYQLETPTTAEPGNGKGTGLDRNVTGEAPKTVEKEEQSRKEVPDDEDEEDSSDVMEDDEEEVDDRASSSAAGSGS